MKLEVWFAGSTEPVDLRAKDPEKVWGLFLSSGKAHTATVHDFEDADGRTVRINFGAVTRIVKKA